MVPVSKLRKNPLTDAQHMSHLEHGPVKAELDRLTMKFFHTVSFEPGEAPSYASIAALFIERGLLIKNVGSAPEISSVQEFITPREVDRMSVPSQ
jgi:hypothetical protein